MADLHCPLCKNSDCFSFYFLGNYPLVNSIDDPDAKYPLEVYRCRFCNLVFVNTPKAPCEIFINYSYFSSWSASWLRHCYTMFKILVTKYNISKESTVIEIASNDGYMLENFKKAGFGNIIGIEPAENVAKASESKGIPTINNFFSKQLALELVNRYQADCIIANNVLAHVPDIMDFLQGISILLKTSGFAVFEFHHLLSLIKHRQFDTIYHEHFSYLSLFSVDFAVRKCGLRIFNAEQLSTHGGSLRIFVSHKEGNELFPLKNSVRAIGELEHSRALFLDATYEAFAEDIGKKISSSAELFRKIKSEGMTIAGYGAAAKAVIFINALGLTRFDLTCVADKNPVKQCKNIPGTDIPVVAPVDMTSSDPDYVIIFPWNIKDEIIDELKSMLPEKTKYITFMPDMEIV